MEGARNCFGLCFGLLLFCLAHVSPGAEQPHILLLVDDMGYGDPGCYNPPSKIATPNMDRLAREGLRLTDAQAPGPLCQTSRSGQMTGRYPFRADLVETNNLHLKHPAIVARLEAEMQRSVEAAGTRGLISK